MMVSARSARCGRPEQLLDASIRCRALPLAPALFSTITCWPNTRPKCCPTSRAAMSVEPPAANGTITWTGRFGHCWASRSSAKPRTKAASAARNSNDRHCCPLSPLNKTAPELPIRRAPATFRISNSPSARARTLRRAEQLVAVRAEPHAPDLHRRPSALNALRRRPRTGRARRQFNSPPKPAPAASARTDTSVEVMRMPTASIMSSVEISLALARGSAPRPAPARLAPSPPAAVDQVQPLEPQRPFRLECRARRKSPKAARAARSATAARSRLGLREQRAQQSMQAPEIVTHRRRSDERPLALLAHEHLLSHQLLYRLSQRDAAHAVSLR